MLGLSSGWGPKLFGREIIFEEFQPMCCWYLNVTDRRTDRRLTVALPRCALASRGKKSKLAVVLMLSDIVWHYSALWQCRLGKRKCYQNVKKTATTNVWRERAGYTKKWRVTYCGLAVKCWQSCTEFAEVGHGKMASTRTVLTIVLLTELRRCQAEDQHQHNLSLIPSMSLCHSSDSFKKSTH